MRLKILHIWSNNLKSLRTHSDLRAVLQIFREELSTQSPPACGNWDDLLTDAVHQGVQRTIAG